MFIYPLVYTLMWLIPFAMHCMNYWDRWAQTPVEFLRVGSSICIALMGFTDALIFSLREKPWRGIEGSDGTFWGSFVCQWCGLGDVEVAGSGVDVGGRGGRDRGSQSYRTSASGDFARVAAEQARVRLELEREERLAALEFKQGDQLRAEEQGDKFEGKVDRKHKGLKVGDGDEGQVYDDNGLEDNTAKLPYNEGYRV
jgi:G protein-coupled receptor GPR1